MLNPPNGGSLRLKRHYARDKLVRKQPFFSSVVMFVILQSFGANVHIIVYFHGRR